MTHKDILQFCPACFASEENGSWSHVVVGGHCTNCGNGSTIAIPRWAVDSIRAQASWVGKRYYPNEEDNEAWEERKALLATITEFPGRTAAWRVLDDGSGVWEVKQQLPRGSSVSTWCRQANSAEEAIATCGLRYVPREAL